MCAIVGAVLHRVFDPDKLADANKILSHIWMKSHERGRDGRGYMIDTNAESSIKIIRDTLRKESRIDGFQTPSINVRCTSAVMIGNLRAEPTTEFVLDKKTVDQQPYKCDGWVIVHNGTVANDKELRTGKIETGIDSAAIAEQLSKTANDFDSFCEAIGRIEGSYAILAHQSVEFHILYAAVNYRPLWYIVTEIGVFFASARDYFPDGPTPQMLEPYSAAKFDANGLVARRSLRSPTPARSRALVVCSGGLDSVVSAAWAKREGYSVELVHFRYGSRAQGPEVTAVREVSKYLECPLTLFPLMIYSKGDSPLLDKNSVLAGGEAGSEFAHEWVPARNLVLLSVATAFAEARGIETIILGNNLEEAGAYPDNEPEFINRFNDLLPFAVGDGKRMEVIMPVGNMMKHEIVALGKKVNAPMHLTWSCYRAGQLHCGTCGPCYMRRKAFEINKIPEVISYLN